MDPVETDAIKIVGIGFTVISALIAWLGALWQKRILQREQAKYSQKLEELRHERGLTKSTYERYLDSILDYYKVFYKHYRLCQRAANADGHRQPDGTITKTKDDFFEGLELFLSDIKDQEGRLRLLLPSNILSIHEESYEAFNRFKDAVKQFKNTDETREKKRQTFAEIERIKTAMEIEIRQFLRTERLLK